MIPYSFLNRTFDFRISTRKFWSAEPELPNGTLEIFTDDSKMSNRAECCIVIKCANIKLFKLPDHCNVLQAVVMTILKTGQCL